MWLDFSVKASKEREARQCRRRAVDNDVFVQSTDNIFFPSISGAEVVG